MTTESESTLTGAAFDLASAGYSSMNDPDERSESEAIVSGVASLREAADRRGEDDKPVMVREYVDAAGKPAAPNEAITLSRAARDHARVREAEKRASDDEHEATGLPADRSDGSHQDLDLLRAEVDGVGPRDREAAQSGDDQSDNKTLTDGLAPELEKALQHPQVLQAIEEKIAEAEQARQGYRDGLAAASQIAQASFLAQFPEFSGMHSAHVPAALEKMSREDPAKFARIQAAVAASETLIARHAQEHQRQAEASHQSFQRFAAAEDARLGAMLENEPKSVRHAVATEILAAARENGIEAAELNRLFHTEPVMRNAAFQRMMYDAAKYRLMIKAKDAVAARPVPPVMRPGVAAAAAGRERSDLRSLNARLSSSGDLKDAVALYQARRSNRP
jgi:hypothetical protein